MLRVHTLWSTDSTVILYVQLELRSSSADWIELVCTALSSHASPIAVGEIVSSVVMPVDRAT